MKNNVTELKKRHTWKNPKTLKVNYKRLKEIWTISQKIKDSSVFDVYKNGKYFGVVLMSEIEDLIKNEGIK